MSLTEGLTKASRDALVWLAGRLDIPQPRRCTKAVMAANIVEALRGHTYRPIEAVRDGIRQAQEILRAAPQRSAPSLAALSVPHHSSSDASLADDTVLLLLEGVVSRVWSLV